MRQNLLTKTFAALFNAANDKSAAPVETDMAEGIVCLGYNGTTNFVWSRPRACIEALTPQSMTEATLLTVYGVGYGYREFFKRDEKTGEVRFDAATAREYLIDGCVNQGRYAPDHERAAGIWPTTDGALLINGKHAIWRSDGQPVDRAWHEGYTYPVPDKLDIEPETPCATASDVALLRSFLDSWTWKHDSHKLLLTGWYVTAVLSGALKRRPHAVVSGRRGTGKTQLRDVLAQLLGDYRLSVDGNSTEAGIRQGLKGSPLPVEVDEGEGHNGKKVLDLVRMARSSYSDEGDGVLRGSAGGKAVKYPIRSSFLLTAITPPAFEPADATRWVSLEIEGLKPEAKKALHPFLRDGQLCEEVGRRLMRLVIARWSVFQASLAAFSEVIVRQSGSPRMAATVGTLLAGWWSLTHDTAAEELDAELHYQMLEQDEQNEAQEASDEADCLEVIFSSTDRFSIDRGGVVSQSEMTIGQAIRKACLGDTSAGLIHTELQTLGLRVFRQEGNWSLGIVISPHHQGVLKLFRGTKWARGGWKMQLLRVDGAREDQQRIANQSRKIVRVPVPADLLVSELESSALATAGSKACSWKELSQV